MAVEQRDLAEDRPLPSTLNTASLPSTEGALIFTVPAPMANRQVPGSPLAQIAAPRFTDFETMQLLSRSICVGVSFANR